MLFTSKILLITSTVLHLRVSLISCDDAKQPWELDPDLPPDTFPLFHDVSIIPEMSNGTFSGNVVIDIRTTIEKRYLWLHYNSLDITDTAVMTSSMEIIPVVSTFKYKTNDFFVIQLGRTLPPGDYKLRFNYSGVIVNGNENGRNFFIVYEDSHNKEGRIEYSARCFPNFRQDTFKSTFQLRVVQPSKSYTVLSNTLPESVTQDLPSTGMATIKFEKTPKMRSGAAFFMVTPMDSLPKMYTRDHIAVTFYGRTIILKYLQRSLKVAVGALDYYTSYLNYSLPLKKIDLVAFPPGLDVSRANAFEAFGLGGFAEGSVTYEAGVTASGNDYNSVPEVSHEMAHSWFGELVGVTMDSETFLDEALATYFEKKAAAYLYPEWDTTALVLIDCYYNAMPKDLYENLPLVTTVPTNKEGSIAWRSLYSKGVAVLLMMWCVMGENNMRLGFMDYVNKFAYKTALVVNLWETMQPHAPPGVNITKLMMTWTQQTAFPLLSVDRNDKTLILSQSRFLADKNTTYDPSESPFGYRWIIPVTIKGSNGYEPDETYWMDLDKNLTIVLPADVTWVKLNIKHCGYFRVNYLLEDWNRLAMLLVHNINALDGIERANLLDDVFALAESRYIPYEVALTMTLYMDQETYYLPWFVLLQKHIDNIVPYVDSTPGFALFVEYFSSKLGPHIDNSLWIFSPASSPDKRLQKALMIEYACWLNVNSCLVTAKRLFDNWLFHCGSKLPVDLRKTVYEYGIALGGIYEWETLWNVYLNESDEDERGKYRSALCHTRQAWIILHLFDIAQKEELVDFIVTCAYNPAVVPTVWLYVRQNWKFLVANFPNDVVSIISILIYDFVTEVQMKEVEVFFETVPEEDIGAGDREYILGVIKTNIALQSKYNKALSKWFQEVLQKKI